MTGYTIKKMLPAELILSQSKISVFLVSFTMAGILLIILSVMAKYKIINPPAVFFNLFLGMGIIFTAGGIIFMMQKIPDTISFNKDRSSIVFTENNQEYSVPFAGFRKLIITGKLSQSQNSSALTYQLNLISSKGSGILLCESDLKTDLQKTAETIIHYIDIDLISGADRLHKGAGVYSPAVPVYPPLGKMSIKADTGSGTATYKWNYRNYSALIFLLGAVVFGFNYVFFKAAFPSLGSSSPGLYAGIIVLVLIDLFFSITLIFNIFGTNIVQVNDSMFSHHQRIFGFNINRKSFSRDEIGMISCGFTSDENKITIFTRRGMEIFNEMKVFSAMNDLNDKSLLLSLIPRVMELRSNIIEIDGGPLYYYEKLYLENEWSGKLNLKENVHPD